MRYALAAGAVWLALVSGAAALAPAAGFELAPAADQDLDQNSTWWWRTHAAKPQQELVAKDETQVTQEDALPPPAWAQADPGAQEAPAAVRARPPGSEPPPAELFGMADGGFCVDKPIFEGPTQGWEHCRSMCRGPCKFYSYWRDSRTHKCKLTTGCRARGNDARYSASAYRAQHATDEGDDHEQRSF